MRANYIHLEKQLRAVLDSSVQGDFAELGVWYGTTFMPMAELARVHGRVIHAVDSFFGMDEETERDGGQYIKGTLSVGGSAIFRKLIHPFGDVVKLHEGYVPGILDEMRDCRFSFVHIDLDQYMPTLLSLIFIWPRMNKGGIVVCHDWFENKDILAAGAIADWMKHNNIKMAGSQESSHCWFIKE